VPVPKLTTAPRLVAEIDESAQFNKQKNEQSRRKLFIKYLQIKKNCIFYAPSILRPSEDLWYIAASSWPSFVKGSKIVRIDLTITIDLPLLIVSLQAPLVEWLTLGLNDILEDC
jgi:hypothetical protein